MNIEMRHGTVGVNKVFTYVSLVHNVKLLLIYYLTVINATIITTQILT
ncbi:hypothetical protein E2C01_072946 [Portunus trituberculatus]|uniref:Uncharacterized protein n=1 Tax=Portunus trituberculatus TaxID=210409 RepID=A0A5B7I1G5_PORTR|nr:hypothetical protein [Portunus trituberculatus]